MADVTTTTPTPDPAAMPTDTTAAPPMPESVPQPNVTMAPAYTPGSTVSSATGQIAQVNPPAAPEPHSRLLAMVHGLASGLQIAGATMKDVGTSLGSHGREQGTALADIQKQKIAAQQASIASREADTRIKLMTIQTNAEQARLNQLLQSIPLEHEEAVTRLAGLKQTQAITAADFAATHGGMTAEQFSAAMNEPATGAPAAGGAAAPADVAAPAAGAAPAGAPAAGGVAAAPAAGGAAAAGTAPGNWFMAGAQRTLRAATQSGLTAENPAVRNMQSVLANPSATKGDVYRATQQLAAEQEAQSKATTEKAARATAAGAEIKTQQETMANDAYLRSVPKNAAGQPTQDFATWQMAQSDMLKQKIEEGDPTPVGDMLAEGGTSPSQVISSRSMSRPFYSDVLKEANRRSLELTGKPFNMAAAEQQYKFVTQFNDPNGRTQQNINSGNTFLEHTGDLVTVTENFRTTNAKIVNTPINKVRDQFGDPTITTLQAAIQPVITEYQNALAAGFAPQAADAESARVLLSPASTPAQIEAAAKQMAHTVVRRMSNVDQEYRTHTGVHYPNMITPDARTSVGKVGGDVPAALGEMQTGGTFGAPTQPVNAGTTPPPPAAKPTRPAGATGAAPGSDGKMYYHDITGKILGPAPETNP